MSIIKRCNDNQVWLSSGIKIHFIILSRNYYLSLPSAAAPLFLPAGTVDRVKMRDEPTYSCRIK